MQVMFRLRPETQKKMMTAANCLPAPLVPPDVDLRNFGYMPLDVLRLRDSDLAALASGAEFRAAVLAWCVAWHQVPAASLPDDDRLLAKYVGVTPAAWRRLRKMALHGFVKCSDGRLYHEVLAEKALEAARKRMAASKRGKAGASARWMPDQCTGISSGIACANALAMPEHEVLLMPGDGKGEERKGKERKEEKALPPTSSLRSDVPPAGGDPPEVGKRKHGNGKFHPPTLTEVEAYCRDRGNAVDAPKFLAHYEANGWRVGRNPMRDWQAAVRTWERSDFDRPGTPSARPIRYLEDPQ